MTEGTTPQPGPPPNPQPPAGEDATAGGPPPAPGPPLKFCHACGQQIDARAEICPRCGVRQPWQAGMPGGPGVQISTGNAVTRTGKSKLVAALLAIFLGGIGIHKFYLGEMGMGLLYLVFFWTAIPAIVGLIEGILWLVQSDEEWLRKYGDR
jgi:TM2 domain-containing membrane protein YozV